MPTRSPGKTCNHLPTSSTTPTPSWPDNETVIGIKGDFASNEVDITAQIEAAETLIIASVGSAELAFQFPPGITSDLRFKNSALMMNTPKLHQLASRDRQLPTEDKDNTWAQPSISHQQLS
jgi:hypothetical protein